MHACTRSMYMHSCMHACMHMLQPHCIAPHSNTYQYAVHMTYNLLDTCNYVKAFTTKSNEILRHTHTHISTHGLTKKALRKNVFSTTRNRVFSKVERACLHPPRGRNNPKLGVPSPCRQSPDLLQISQHDNAHVRRRPAPRSKSNDQGVHRAVAAY